MARLLGEFPERQLEEDLFRWKQLMEAGEIPTTRGQPSGARRRRPSCWLGKNTVRVMSVPDPVIINPRDAIIRVTLTAICGSDLHLYDGYIPGDA